MTKTSEIICTGCDFSTDVVYDAAAHSYAFGKEHSTITRPKEHTDDPCIDCGGTQIEAEAR